MKLLFLLFLLTTPAATFAEDAPSPGQVKKSFDETWKEAQARTEIIHDDRVVFRPGSPYYPISVAETGAQGKVILLLDLSKDGRVNAAHVQWSSRSKELDAAAIRKAMTMSYQGRGTPPATASLTFQFLRDTIDSMGTKSCRYINTDLAWFRKAFPELPDTELTDVIVLGNLVGLNWGSADQSERAPILKAVPFAQCAVISQCAAQPDSSVSKVFNRAMKEQIDNPKSEQELCAFATPTVAREDNLPRSLLHTRQLDEPLPYQAQKITPGMPAYPPQLVAAGIQGQVSLEVTVSSEGQVKGIKVSSNQYESAALAEAAIAHARGLPYGAVVRKDAPDTVFIVPFEFMKDTEVSIGSKTCADFNVDVAALRVAHPKAEVAFMNAVQVARDIFIHHRFAVDAASWPSRSQTKKDADAVAVLCAEKPEAGFMEVFRQQLMSAEP